MNNETAVSVAAATRRDSGERRSVASEFDGKDQAGPAVDPLA